MILFIVLISIFSYVGIGLAVAVAWVKFVDKEDDAVETALGLGASWPILVIMIPFVLIWAIFSFIKAELEDLLEEIKNLDKGE